MTIDSLSTFQDLGQASYKATNCSTKLPVLCFVNGYYVPAMEINPDSTIPQAPTVKTATFLEAEEACYNIGREVGTLSSLASLFMAAYSPSEDDPSRGTQRTEVTMRSLPTLNGVSSGGFVLTAPSDVKFDFVNNTTRGMFLAPLRRQYSFIPNGKIRDNINSVFKQHKTMWTAMEWDKGGLPVASAPWALVAKDEPYSLFFNKDRSVANRPVLVRDMEEGFDISSQYFALVHDLRWKGLVPVQKSKVLPAVCQRKNDKSYFISSSKGVLSRAHEICKAEGGFFLPPESGYNWAKLMLSLNPNDSHYSFPDPEIGDELPNSNSYIYNRNVDCNDSSDPSCSSHSLAYVAFKSSSSFSPEKQGPKARDLDLYVDYLPSGSGFHDAFSGIKSGHHAIKKDGTLQNFKFHDKVPSVPLFSPGSSISSIVAEAHRIFSKAQAIFSKNINFLCFDANTSVPVSIVNSISSCLSTAQAVSDITYSGGFRPESFVYIGALLKLMDRMRDEDLLVLNQRKYDKLKAAFDKAKTNFEAAKKQWERDKAAWEEAERRRREEERRRREEERRKQQQKQQQQQQQQNPSVTP